MITGIKTLRLQYSIRLKLLLNKLMPKFLLILNWPKMEMNIFN